MSVRLSPLSDAEMHGMLEQYLPGVGNEVIAHIAQRSAGFPLYAVEIVRMLTASGDLRRDGSSYRYQGDAAAMALPETLQTVIGARLDRLDAESRALLQDGSVLGQTFTLEAMGSLRDVPPEEIERGLQPLVHLELLDLEDDPRSPERGQYRFVQSLIHEVAYRRLGRADRRAKHLAAAAYFGGRDDPELAGIVAGHYMGAYEATPAGPERDEMVTLAVDTLTSAADRAAQLQSHQQAVELLEQAIDIAPEESHRTEQRLKAAYAASFHNEPDRGLAHLEAARGHFERTGDVDGIRRTATAASYIYNSHFQSDKALEVIRPVYEDVETVDDLVTIHLASEAARSFSLTFTEQDSLAAITAADRLLPAAEALGESEIVLHALISKATAMSHLNRRVEAYSLLRGAAYEAEQRGLLEAVVRALNNLSSVMGDRNPQEAVRVAEHLHTVVTRTQQHAWLVRGAADISSNETKKGAYDRALAPLDAFGEEDLSPLWTARFALNRALVGFRRTGEEEYLVQWQEQAAALFDGQHDPQVQTIGQELRALRARDAGDWTGAFEEAIKVDPALGWGGIWLASTAAAWLGDLDRLQIPERHLTESHNLLPGLADYVAAIRLALEGRTAEATARFVETLDLWSSRLLPDDLAMARVTFARLMGLDDPAARQAAEAAAAWLDETGSHGLRAAWAEALPASSDEATAAG
jgi:tetratricopeptide (TPR) repeat protein